MATPESHPIEVTGMTVVAVYDFSYDGNPATFDRALVEFSADNRKTRLWDHYDASFEWMFYRGVGARDKKLAASLPGTYRYVLPPEADASGDEDVDDDEGVDEELDAADGAVDDSTAVSAPSSAVPAGDADSVPGETAVTDEDSGAESAPDAVDMPLDDAVGAAWSAVSRGWTLLLSQEHGAGVASFWFRVDARDGPRALADTFDVKGAVARDDKLLGRLIGRFKDCGVELSEIERHYPFTALRLATPAHARDALALDPDQRSELGRVFTGGQGWEERGRLSEYVAPARNLSGRIYERLFVRWTDALGVYDAAMPEGNEDEYARATARAVQVLETCVLVRRILRNIGDDIEQASARVNVLHPRLVWQTRGRLLKRFTDVERAYRIAPPLQSLEGEQLLDSTFDQFGINSLFESTRDSYDSLERRMAIVESQYLLAAGVVAFIANAILTVVS